MTRTYSDLAGSTRRFKERITDPDVIEKARATIALDYTNGFVSDYLGMVIQQVDEIRARARSSVCGRPVTNPDDSHEGTFQATEARISAEEGSRRYFEAIEAYRDKYERRPG